MIKRDILLIAIGYAMAIVWAAIPHHVAIAQQVTTGPPVIKNGTLSSTTVTTLVTGTGSGYIVYSLTNEDGSAGFRCEYGSIGGQAPAIVPTPVTGSLVAPGVTLVERTAPSNRLDCIATAGSPKYDLVLYPK